MSLTHEITLVVAVNNRDILERNLLASPCFRSPLNHQILVQEGFSSAAEAYNDGLDRSTNELVIFAHQDVFLPEGWMARLDSALQHLERTDPAWGVLGCWGAKENGEYRGHVYSSGWGVLGEQFESPEPVQTLDEIVLIFKKRPKLLFDQHLPHFHFYGTDICMRAAKLGMKSYAMSAFCIHNTSQILRLSKDFYRCYCHIRRVWKDDLPIQTTCIRISRFNAHLYRRKLEECCLSHLRQKLSPVPRSIDPIRILKELETAKG
jgi:Glycosyltransferase like family